jgi:hypothetical protein
MPAKHALGLVQYLRTIGYAAWIEDTIASRALNWVRPFLASALGQMLLHRLANRASGPS